MSVRSFRSILTECLESMRGGATVEQCLEQYPKHEKKLRPLLSLAARVRQTPMAAVPPGAQDRAWRSVSERAAELRAGKRGFTMPRVGLSYGRWLKPSPKRWPVSVSPRLSRRKNRYALMADRSSR